MQQALRTRLLNDGTIGGLVGTRVDWNIRPQGKPLPAITLERVVGDHAQTMSGLQVTQGPLIQVDCWASKYTDAAALRDAVIEILTTPAVQSGIRFLGAGNVMDADSSESTDGGIVHRTMIRANVWHTT